MTFTSTRVEAGGKGLLVTGDLSLKGVTKAVTLDVEVLGSEGDPWGGTRVGFEGTTSISRKDFGVDFNIPLDGGRLMIGDKIDIIIGIEAVLRAGRGSDRLTCPTRTLMRTAPGSCGTGGRRAYGGQRIRSRLMSRLASSCRSRTSAMP